MGRSASQRPRREEGQSSLCPGRGRAVQPVSCGWNFRRPIRPDRGRSCSSTPPQRPARQGAPAGHAGRGRAAAPDPTAPRGFPEIAPCGYAQARGTHDIEAARLASTANGRDTELVQWATPVLFLGGTSRPLVRLARSAGRTGPAARADAPGQPGPPSPASAPAARVQVLERKLTTVHVGCAYDAH